MPKPRLRRAGDSAAPQIAFPAARSIRAIVGAFSVLRPTGGSCTGFVSFIGKPLDTPFAACRRRGFSSWQTDKGTISRVAGVAAAGRASRTRQRRILFLAGAADRHWVMPTTMADAVIRTGRIRVCPDRSRPDTPSAAQLPFQRDVTSRKQFAEATPTAMIGPSAKGTLSSSGENNSIVTISAQRPGRARKSLRMVH